MASHSLVGGDVFGVHALCLFNQRLLDLRDGANTESFKFLLHAADRPEQIHGRGARLADDFADLVELFLEIGGVVRLRIFHAERDAHGSGDANGGRSADDHVADGVCDLLVRATGYIYFFSGQLRLIDEDYAVGRPFESLNHELVVGC